MAYELAGRLVVGVASSALFDLAESDAYFQEHGEAKYRVYQEEHIDDTLQPGVAYPFIERLLDLNDLREDDPLVEVIVLSRNDPKTGLRVMRSIETHSLDITRAVFTQGRAPFAYMPALSMDLFLSGNLPDVQAAVERGLPAGHVLPTGAEYGADDRGLRVAFDFDGVLATDEAEQVFADGGIDSFREHEVARAGEALPHGPLKPLLGSLNLIQDIEEERRLEDPTYEPRVRIALVTARNAPAHERAVRSLEEWGVAVNDAFFLGGVSKADVLGVLRPHVFFDDQVGHLTEASKVISTVHIPYGVANLQASDD